jgi:hypothetical protein
MVILGAAHQRVIRSTGKSLGLAVDHRPMRPRPAVWMLHGDIDCAPESAGEFVDDRRDAVVILDQHPTRCCGDMRSSSRRWTDLQSDRSRCGDVRPQRSRADPRKWMV